MPDEKKTTTSSAVKPAKTLSPAGESSDPAIHKLLADLDIARRNNDAASVQAAVDTLAALGFAA